MKKKIALLLILLIFIPILLLSGCADTRTKLYVLSFRPEDQDYYDWMVAEFEKEFNCDVVYEAVDTNQYPTILKGRLAADAVDVFGTQPSYLNDESIHTYMLELDDMSYNDKIEDTARDQSILNGHWLMTPLNYVILVVFYNKDVFEELNLSAPTTYSQFIDICDALEAKVGKKVAGKTIQAPILYGGLEGWPVNMVMEAIELPVVRMADPNFYIDVWYNQTKDFEHALYKEYIGKARQIMAYMQPNATGLSYGSIPRYFSSGQYPMTIDGSWAYKNLIEAIDGKFELGTFLLPGSDIAERNTIAASKVGGGWSIAKSSKQIELAKKFLEFQMREDIYQRYLDVVQMDSVIDGMESSNAAVREMYDRPMAISFDVYKIRGMSYSMNDTIGPMIYNGSVSVDEICRHLKEDCDSSKVFWQNSIASWMSRFHPGYSGN